MKLDVLIVEDEILQAERLARFLRNCTAVDIRKLTIKSNFKEALNYMKSHPLDLLFLDLNLHGENGFDLLQQSVSHSFQTVIVSAYADRAIIAFEYGVLDFISKPISQERIHKALDRYIHRYEQNSGAAKYLAVKKHHKLQLVPIDQIIYLKGAGNYTELHLNEGKTELHSKSLNDILYILPDQFVRVHKSYIVDFGQIESIHSTYEIKLKSEIKIPISRSKYHELKNRLS